MDKPRAWIARYHPVESCCDPARRMADAITLHAIAGSEGRYLLIRLDDGRDDGTVYETRWAAEAHKKHPATIAVIVPPGGMAAREAEEVLHYHRDIYDKLGGRPLELPHLMPLTRADQRRQIAAFQRG